MIYYKKILTLSTFILLLTACGGGGTSDVSQNSDTNIDNTITVDDTTTTDTSRNQGDTTVSNGDSKQLGMLDTDGYAKDITLSPDGSIVYIADGTMGLKIINVSDPTKPTLMGNIFTNGYAEDVLLSADGSFLFMSDSQKGLHIIDVSDPKNPTILTTLLEEGDNIQGSALSQDESKLYIANKSNGFKILDISNIYQPITLATHVSYSARDIKVTPDDKKLYLADGTNGLVVYDISDLNNIEYIGLANAIGFNQKMVLSSNPDIVYAACSGFRDGVTIIDTEISSKETKAVGLITWVETENTHGVARSSDDTRIYAANDVDGLVIIDRETRTILGTIKTDQAMDVVVSPDNTKAYVADWLNGLKVLDITSDGV